LSAADREWLARLGATIVAIPPPAAGPGRNGQVRVDPEGKLAAWIGTRAARVLLARPDRFVAGDVQPARAGELVRWLRDLLPRAVSAPDPATHDENFVSPEPNGEDHGDQRAAVSN
ncbi:MAG: hypothetical protein KC466_14925, partial [Myxococcales bacterium]|nr:hypothetical protein [Myxococcales bacterium]